MTKYYYQGQEVLLVPGQQFSTHWNVTLADGKGGTQTISAQPGVDLFIREDGEAPPTEEEMQAELVAAEGETTSEPVNINLASMADIRKAFPSLGRIAAKQIPINRPEIGYQSFEELVDLNKGKCPQNVQWDSIKELVVFE